MTRIVEVRRAEEADIGILCAGLRDADRASIGETGRTAEDVVWYCFQHSSRRRVGLVDGEIAAMWGCGGVMLGVKGEPWLFATAAIERAPVSALRIARREIAAMGRMFPVLTGILHRSDGRACRFADRLGLKITEDYSEAFVRYAKVAA